MLNLGFKSLEGFEAPLVAEPRDIADAEAMTVEIAFKIKKMSLDRAARIHRRALSDIGDTEAAHSCIEVESRDEVDAILREMCAVEFEICGREAEESSALKASYDDPMALVETREHRRRFIDAALSQHLTDAGRA